jgi:type I restriction enzyme, S subunit
MSDWRRSKWGDEIRLEYGKALRGYSPEAGQYRVFGANGPIGWTDVPLAHGPGVILGRKGAYRGVQYCREPFFVIDTAYYTVPLRAVDMRWLYYAMIHYRLGDIDDGSPIPSTTRAAVYVRELLVPPLEEQQRISEVLGALDDKIDVNRRMIETLEAMARAIFKDWFIDFGPVRAKMEGRPAYLAPAVWELFPRELGVDGRPAGWSISGVYQFASVVYGAPYSSSMFNNEGRGLPLLRIRDLSDHDPEVYTEEVLPRGEVIEPGAIVVGMDGEFRLHFWCGPRSLLNQRVCCFRPRVGVPAAFLAEALKEPLAFFERGKVGTTVIHLGKRDIDTFQLLLPSQAVFAAFGAVTDPLLQRMLINAAESRTLTVLRDLLLPKLMSGEIRIRTAEKAVEAVA